MENTNITRTASLSANLDEASVTASNVESEMLDNTASEKSTRKPRRSAKEIQAEYEKFKVLLDEGRPILEIIRTLGIRKSQADSYLMKISLEKHRRGLNYGVCEGHSIADSIRDILGGTRKDLFKFERFKDGNDIAVLIKLHMLCG